MKTLAAIFVSILIVFSASTLNAQQQQRRQLVQLERGLILNLPFNGDATDASTFGHHGSIQNATLTTDRHGKANSAYQFNGRNSYIDVAHTPRFNVNYEATFSAWIYQTSINQDMITPTLYSGRILEKGNAGVNNGFLVDAIHVDPIHTVTSDADICNCPDEQTAIRFIGGNAAYSNKNCYALNEWQHIIVTFKRGEVKLYYNGVLVSQSILTNTAIPNNQLPVRIGATQPLNGFNHLSFRGKIDEVRIYNRALNPREINALYQLQ
jgi:Concanavalin A-like lectin/glucanases superfamily